MRRCLPCWRRRVVVELGTGGLRSGRARARAARHSSSLRRPGKVQSFGRGRALRWMTPPVPGFRQSCYSRARYRATSMRGSYSDEDGKMKRSKAEILQEYGPFPIPSRWPASPSMAGTSGSPPADRLNALDPESGKTVRSIDVAAHAGTAFDGPASVPDCGRSYPEDRSGDRPRACHHSGACEGGDSGLAWAGRNALGGPLSRAEDPPGGSRHRKILRHHRIQPGPSPAHLGRWRTLHATWEATRAT